MYGNWWWNKPWTIRETGPLSYIFDENDTLVLEPNDMTGAPSFFWTRFKNQNPKKAAYWKDQYVYQVGVTAPSVSLAFSWDDTQSSDQQGDDVLNEYHRAVKQARVLANNPYSIKLEGHIFVHNPDQPDNDHYEIVRIFCFQGIQPNGRDWITFDALQTIAPSSPMKRSRMQMLEDGTAHGDPP